MNEMYTVRGFNPFDGGLVLREVKSPRSAYHAFSANRFRKVDYSFTERIMVDASFADGAENPVRLQAENGSTPIKCVKSRTVNGRQQRLVSSAQIITPFNLPR